ncbi:hypothetical protein D3C71_2093690 [compost metagenome]
MVEDRSSAAPNRMSASAAPPIDNGRAIRMVIGCRKSLNRSTSTAVTIRMPASRASAKLRNISDMYSASP